MADHLETSTNSRLKSKQVCPGNSQLPCPKHQRITRSSTRSSNLVDYSMKYHPLDEISRSNHPATLRHRLIVSSKEMQDKRETSNNDSNDPALGDEKAETVSKRKSSKTNRRVRRARKQIDKNRYNMSYHPLDDILPGMTTNKISTWLKSISIPTSTTPVKQATGWHASPDSSIGQNSDKIRDNHESPTHLTHIPPDLNATPSNLKKDNLFLQQSKKTKRLANKPKLIESFFQVLEDSPDITTRIKKESCRHQEYLSQDIQKENLVAEAQNLSQDLSPSEYRRQHQEGGVDSPTSPRTNHFQAIRISQRSESSFRPVRYTAERSSRPTTPWLPHVTEHEAIMPIFNPTRRFVRPTAADFM